MIHKGAGNWPESYEEISTQFVNPVAIGGTETNVYAAVASGAVSRAVDGRWQNFNTFDAAMKALNSTEFRVGKDKMTGDELRLGLGDDGMKLGNKAVFPVGRVDATIDYYQQEVIELLDREEPHEDYEAKIAHLLCETFLVEAVDFGPKNLLTMFSGTDCQYEYPGGDLLSLIHI